MLSELSWAFEGVSKCFVIRNDESAFRLHAARLCEMPKCPPEFCPELPLGWTRPAADMHHVLQFVLAFCHLLHIVVTVIPMVIVVSLRTNTYRVGATGLAESGRKTRYDNSGLPLCLLAFALCWSCALIGSSECAGRGT